MYSGPVTGMRAQQLEQINAARQNPLGEYMYQLGQVSPGNLMATIQDQMNFGQEQDLLSQQHAQRLAEIQLQNELREKAYQEQVRLARMGRDQANPFGMLDTSSVTVGSVNGQQVAVPQAGHRDAFESLASTVGLKPGMPLDPNQLFSAVQDTNQQRIDNQMALNKSKLSQPKRASAGVGKAAKPQSNKVPTATMSQFDAETKAHNKFMGAGGGLLQTALGNLPFVGDKVNQYFSPPTVQNVASRRAGLGDTDASQYLSRQPAQQPAQPKPQVPKAMARGGGKANVAGVDQTGSLPSMSQPKAPSLADMQLEDRHKLALDAARQDPGQSQIMMERAQMVIDNPNVPAQQKQQAQAIINYLRGPSSPKPSQNFTRNNY